jgi:hypothetical protein
MWFPNSAITDFSPECSSSKLGNDRSAKGGLKGLHGDAGAENEKMFLENTLEFVTGGGGIDHAHQRCLRRRQQCLGEGAS